MFRSCFSQETRWDQARESHGSHVIRVWSYKINVETVSKCLVIKTPLARSYIMSSPWCRLALSLMPDEIHIGNWRYAKFLVLGMVYLFHDYSHRIYQHGNCTNQDIYKNSYRFLNRITSIWMDIAAIWQRDNKNSNHSRIEKNTEIIVFEPLRFILLLSAN